MKQAILKSLQINNFRSFTGKHVINFPDNGLCVIKGKNLDSNGESGAGKSSILLALSYVLGYSPYSYKDLVSWNTEDNMSVSIELETEHGHIILSRGKEYNLSINGIEELGGAEHIKRKIDEIIGLNSTFRSITSYREQGVKGYFFNIRDSEKKEFLTELLDIGWIENEIEASREIKEIINEPKANTLKTEIDYSENNLQSKISSIKEPTKEDLSELYSQVNTLTHLKDELNNKFNSLRPIEMVNDLNNNEIKKIEVLIVSKENEANEIRNKRKILDSEIFDLRNKITEIKTFSKLFETYQKQISTIYNELQSLSENKCPTCIQQWINSNAIAERQAKLDDLLNKSTEIQIKTNSLPKLEASLKDLQDKLNLEQIDPILDEMSILKNRIIKIKSDSLKDINEQNNKKNEILTKINGINVKISEINSIIKKSEITYDTQLAIYNTNLNGIENLKIKIKELYDQLSLITNVIDLEKDYIEFLKGFINRYFNEVLLEIENQSNAVINKLSNVSHITIQFNTEKETLKGTIKESITPVLLFDGEEHPFKSGLSGGMQTSIELAVDLALIDVISKRTGAGLGWLALDESFNGLDLITKEACLEVLKTYAENRLIIVIDHASEFKEFFDKTINVIYKNGQSMIE